MSPRSPSSSRPNGAPARSDGAFRVVWAEDSDSDRYLIRNAIQGTPFEDSVTFAFDGKEALDLVRKRTPSGLVLDINMPGMDGITALARLRERHAGLPVVMFSTANDAEQTARCRALGVLAYAVKPVDYDSFRIVIGRLLGDLQRASHAVARSAALLEP